NDYLREWIPKRGYHLQTVLSLEAPSDPSLKCQSCRVRSAKWRCRECVGGRLLCGLCCRNEHQFLLFHRVEKWNGRYFHVGALWEVGVKLHLGHQGMQCDVGREPVRDPDGESYKYADDEEIEDDFDVNAAHPETLPRPRPTDNDGHKFITIVDVSGIHHLPVVKCGCHPEVEEQLQYIEMGLFPNTYDIIKTVFTMNVLNDFRLSNLECKTTAYQYYAKLRRLTCPAFPKAVLNRYRELRRLSREYRNLKLWKCMAVGMTNLPAAPEIARGKLGLFCPTCPQPGVNLPDEWTDDPLWWLYIRKFCADGNFKADHLNQKNEHDDVHLTNGEAFMTAPKPYEEHLVDAAKHAHKYAHPTCHVHRAHKDGEKVAAGRRVRGIGAQACARHGCFCPSSVVDFELGERQMCMDFSLSEAFKTTHMEGISCTLCVYDIMCQYHVKLTKRFREQHGLTLPATLKLMKAIGLWHVHGHKEECLYRFATTYIPGVGIVDGEILETLWSLLNRTSRSARGVTTAHRTEILDDHMGDSNWKKTINMASTVTKKYFRAVKEQQSSQDYYDGLTEAAPTELIPEWTEQIIAAEGRRQNNPDVMDIYQVKVKKAPTRREIELQLSEKELRGGEQTGQATWISQGLKLEEAQFDLRSHVRKLGLTPTTAQKLELVAKRRQNRKLVDGFMRSASEYLGAEMTNGIYDANPAPVIDAEVSENEDPEVHNPRISRADPERQGLPFPSAIALAVLTNLPVDRRSFIQSLRDTELHIRSGHADDALELVRGAVIQLSWQYKNRLRGAIGAQRTRSWDKVNLLNKIWKLQRRVYNHNREVMMSLDDTGTIAVKYPELLISDCTISTAVSEPNAYGQSTDRLPWFWSSARPGTLSVPESEYYNEFYRVNWLRARAQRGRWAEELILTRREMQWTVRFYVHMAEKWKARRDTWLLHRDPDGQIARGHRAYAEQQMAMWNELGRVSEVMFTNANSDHTCSWRLVV
ncbi:hypothetical protein BDZ97DRAFT_1672276, partial [Flammula alnicola]